MLQTAHHSRWSNEYVLDCVLHITYASYVVMLEFRTMGYCNDSEEDVLFDNQQTKS